MYLIIIFLPFFAAFFSGIMGRILGVQGVFFYNILCLGLCTILAIFAFLEVNLANSPVTVEIVPWISSENFNITWSFYFDELTVSMLIPVLIVSFLVHLFSVGYMSEDPHQQRFFSFISLFTGLMLVLVTGNNFLVMFIGWEGVGVCSYLLVHFWYTRVSAVKSAMNAMFTNRVGDYFLTLGFFALFFTFNSLDYSTIFALAPLVNNNIITFIVILLFLGATAKSAQIGLHSWLPQAMEGPTPVSALIHAATMVTAGVYLLIRCSPLIEQCHAASDIIAIFGALTCFFAATVGLFQNDIKKVIAYSTMSNLAYVLLKYLLDIYSPYFFRHLFADADGVLFPVVFSDHSFILFRSSGTLLVLKTCRNNNYFYSSTILSFVKFSSFYRSPFILDFTWRTECTTFIRKVRVRRQFLSLRPFPMSIYYYSTSKVTYPTGYPIKGRYDPIVPYPPGYPLCNKKGRYDKKWVINLDNWLSQNFYDMNKSDSIFFQNLSLSFMDQFKIFIVPNYPINRTVKLLISNKKPYKYINHKLKEVIYHKEPSLETYDFIYKLHPYYITGIIELYGQFNIDIRLKSDTNSGLHFHLYFYLKVPDNQLKLLSVLSDYFKRQAKINGSIYNTLVFCINNKQGLIYLIRHLLKYPLNTNKHKDFVIFMRIFFLLDLNIHYSKIGHNLILNLAASHSRGIQTPNGKKSKVKDYINKNYIIRNYNIEFTSPCTIPNSWWVTGISEFRGSFYLYGKRSTDLYFSIFDPDKRFLYLFKNLFNAGYIYYNKKYNLAKYCVRNNKVIIKKIIPFFEEYSLIGDLSGAFIAFKEAAHLLKHDPKAKNCYRRLLILKKEMVKNNDPFKMDNIIEDDNNNNKKKKKKINKNLTKKPLKKTYKYIIKGMKKKRRILKRKTRQMHTKSKITKS
jgi:NADH:ubiquinone oxidoreductase subunit 2 (subunit N)